MTALAELEERRTHECRLTPDRALETLDEAEEFLRDRGFRVTTNPSAPEPWARDYVYGVNERA